MTDQVLAIAVFAAACGLMYLLRLYFTATKKAGSLLEGLQVIEQSYIFILLLILFVANIWTFFEPVVSGRADQPQFSYPLLLLIQGCLAAVFMFFTGLYEHGIAIGIRLYPYESVAFEWLPSNNERKLKLKLHAGPRQVTCILPSEQADKVKAIIEKKLAKLQ